MTEPARLTGLPAIEAAVWRELGRAALDRHHEWRTPVLATAGAAGAASAAGAADAAGDAAGDAGAGAAPVSDDGGWPDARTVVLREVQADTRQLVVYSDARAAKLAQLRRHPRALLVLWSRRLGWQLRLRAQVEVHTDGLAASSRWLKLRATPAAQDYLSPLAPGQLLPAPAPAAAHAGAADAPAAVGAGIGAGTASRREHFAVLVCTVSSADWLELHREGHRRARFDAQGARWLAP